MTERINEFIRNIGTVILMGGTEILRGNLTQRYFVNQKSHKE